MGCSLLLGLLTLENFRSPNLVRSSPAPPAAKMIEKLGQEEARQLLRNLAMEQSRSYLNLVIESIIKYQRELTSVNIANCGVGLMENLQY